DFDGDGSLEIGTAGEDIYVVIDNDMTLLWDLATQDGSQKTGSTVFDFEADGVNEVVYRDELNLYILNGTNGNVISQLGCTSATRLDYPVVADVNQDGQTEIICACNGNNGDIVVFNSSDQPWVQSRPVWNQHTYHNTQINDDMTFDTEWQDHSLVASGLINTFLAQATYATYDGNPLFAAPDAEVSISTVTGADCALTDDYTIEFVVTNKAAASLLLPAGTPVSFYDGNPFNPGATYLGTEVTTINLPAGNSETLTTTVNSATSLFNLYAVANDNGTGTLPLMQPTTNIGECDYTDNLSNVQAVNCDLLPVELTNFSVDLENGRAVLAWETASELNNDFFEVQRSKEGSQFQVIGRVEGNGTTDQASSYSFIDPLLNQGDNYYRLRQVDFDGSQEYSTIEYVFLPSQEEVRLLFNPVSGFIQLTIGKSVASKRTDYEIYNTIGQTVLRGRLEGNQIEISELVPGNYFLRLVTTEGRYTLPFTVK
ncbi:MAG: T9SS type A sorting domain-containing protein, partial [Saprospiraceae bacterium]|nr:T9SS type A sorting domain-containing protein [Saprospiraceae bacterium]